MILAPFLSAIFLAAFRIVGLFDTHSPDAQASTASKTNSSWPLLGNASQTNESSWTDSIWDDPTHLVVAMLAAPIAVLLSEMVCDIHRNMFDDDRRRGRLPELTGLARITAAAEASLIITALEVGRLWGHWNRGGIPGLLSSFGKRFDWHCSKLAGAKESEGERARRKIMTHVIFVAIVCAMAKYPTLLNVVWCSRVATMDNAFQEP